MIAVAVVGASDDPARYSHRAMHRLLAQGYEPIPVTLRGEVVAGRPSVRSLRGIDRPVDAVTMYVAPANQGPVIDDILATNPRRVIFNPGSENHQARQRLQAAGIAVVEACTLVLLDTGRFEDAA